MGILAAVLGREIDLRAQPDDEARAEMEQMPKAYVDAFFEFFRRGVGERRRDRALDQPWPVHGRIVPGDARRTGRGRRIAARPARRHPPEAPKPERRPAQPRPSTRIGAPRREWWSTVEFHSYSREHLDAIIRMCEGISLTHVRSVLKVPRSR